MGKLSDSEEENVDCTGNPTPKRQRILIEEEEEEDDDDNEEAEESEEEEEVVPLNSFVTDKSFSVTFMDLDLLDCIICGSPLTSPVFQCKNGHTACTSCWSILARQCYSCSLPIGRIRSRTIEKILESVKVPCQNMKYGCRETVSYSKKCDHNKTCIYAPCFCPISFCNFINSSKKLYRHLRSKHDDDNVRRFKYDEEITLSFNVYDDIDVLQEEEEGVIFIVNRSEERTGNMITVSCVGPLSTGGHWYELSASTGGDDFRFQSYTKIIQSRADKPPSAGLLLPSCPELFVPYDEIYLDLVIWRKGACPSNVPGSKTPFNSVRNSG